MTFIERLWNTKELRKKILFTLGAIVLIRFAAMIPVPGANLNALRALMDGNSFLGAFSVLTGGSMNNFSIILMGVSPYINASIIIQLLTIIVPKLENLSKEGDNGRQKINAITRWLTLPLSFLQSYGMILLLNQLSQGQKIVEDTTFMSILPMMLTISAGTIFLMWLGEVMSEKGIGNGISIIIFASIVSGIPNLIGQQLGLAQYDSSQLLPLVIIGVLTVALLMLIVSVTEGQRNIPITYAGRTTRSGKGTSVLPIRINQAGMIPIIFAFSIITFPQVVSTFFLNAKTDWIRNFASFINTNFNQNAWWYVLALFILVFFFTMFYVTITFQPQQVAENVQKHGGFVPGIRPGVNTVKFLQITSHRLSIWGGTFLAGITILPYILNFVFSKLALPTTPLLMSGAGMIIVVGVVIEIIKQVNTSLIMHDYEKID